MQALLSVVPCIWDHARANASPLPAPLQNISAAQQKRSGSSTSTNAEGSQTEDNTPPSSDSSSFDLPFTPKQ